MARDFTSVGVIGLGHDGRGDRRGLRPQRPRRDRRRGRRGRHRARPAVARGSSTGAGRGRGKLTQEEPTRCTPGSPSPATSLADLADCRPRGRGRARAPRPQEGAASASSTPSSRPDAVLATNTSSLSVTEIAVATSNPKRVVGMHFFNPAPVQQFVEVDPHRGHRPTTSSTTSRRSPSGSARSRSSSATRRASSPTPCSSATSTTRCRCTRAATRPARTSTPPCASAAATRWARSRCST